MSTPEGLAQACLDAALAYAHERRQLAKPIYDHVRKSREMGTI